MNEATRNVNEGAEPLAATRNANEDQMQIQVNASNATEVCCDRCQLPFPNLRPGSAIECHHDGTYTALIPVSTAAELEAWRQVGRQFVALCDRTTRLGKDLPPPSQATLRSTLEQQLAPVVESARELLGPDAAVAT